MDEKDRCRRRRTGQSTFWDTPLSVCVCLSLCVSFFPTLAFSRAQQQRILGARLGSVCLSAERMEVELLADRQKDKVRFA